MEVPSPNNLIILQQFVGPHIEETAQNYRNLQFEFEAKLVTALQDMHSIGVWKRNFSLKGGIVWSNKVCGLTFLHYNMELRIFESGVTKNN